MSATTDAPQLVANAIPVFEPHPWIRRGHLQTIAGGLVNHRVAGFSSLSREIAIEDGDRLSILESTPEGWENGQPQALVVHGLAGSAQSPYVVRAASRLYRMGVRVVRMNLRGAGAGFGLARGIYHAGRTGDLRRVCETMTESSPRSPLALLGFSLGANLVLKLAGEASEIPVAGLDCVLAANPPLDLEECCRTISSPSNRIYDRGFVRILRAEVNRLHQACPDLGPIDLRHVKSLREFDEAYTSLRNGFENAEAYYARCSSGPFVPRIAVPGLVIHAKDDPLIPYELFHSTPFPSQLALEMTEHGGHVGYVSRKPWKGDRRWLETRLAAWLSERWSLPAD